VALRTAFTEMLALEHPIALAPMGGSAGGALAVVRRAQGAGRAGSRRWGALIVQVTDLDEAVQALEVGAHVLVAQGSEAGGHGGRRATLPFVPVVADLAAPTPVLAAGGIADGRGLGATLVLGAAGALIGTRFQAASEALVAPEVAKAIIEGRGADTERSRVFDIARGAPWPVRYTARTLRNAFLDRWRGSEAELEASDDALLHAGPSLR
jgi:nitronate monooxygenase